MAKIVVDVMLKPEILDPHGNAVATSTQPHFTATGYAETVPDLGGAAGEYFVYDINFILTGKPVRVIA
jgi:hypothetical protein